MSLLPEGKSTEAGSTKNPRSEHPNKFASRVSHPKTLPGNVRSWESGPHHSQGAPRQRSRIQRHSAIRVFGLRAEMEERFQYFKIPATVKAPILVFNGSDYLVSDARIDLRGLRKAGTRRIRADFGPPTGIRIRDVRVYDSSADPEWNFKRGNSGRPGPRQVVRSRPNRLYRGRGRTLRGGAISFDMKNFPAGAALKVWDVPCDAEKKTEIPNTVKPPKRST